MTSNNFRPVTTAPAGTPCGWTVVSEGQELTCHGPHDAVHVLTENLPVAKSGTALCGFHSPFDVTAAERAELSVPAPAPAPVDVVASAEARANADVVKSHKLSPAMIKLVGVMAGAGTVSAWTMRNVTLINTEVNIRTVNALINRGLITKCTNPNEGQPGSLTDYVLSDRGVEVAAALGHEIRTDNCDEAAPLAPVDREAEAYAAWVADKATDPNVEIIDGHPYGRASKLPIFRNVAPGGMGIIARHKAAEAARKATECEACHDAPGDRSLTLYGTFAGSSGPRTPGEQIRLCTPCYRVVLEQTGDRGSGTVAIYWHAVKTPGQVIRYNDPTTVRYLFVERLTGPFDAYDRAREVASVCEPNYSPTITLCGFDNPNHQRAYLVTRAGVDRVEYMTPATAWGLAWELRHRGRDLTFACAEVDPVTGEVVAWLWNNDGTKGDAK